MQAWLSITSFLFNIAQESAPNALELVTPPTRGGPSTSAPAPPQPPALSSFASIHDPQGQGEITPSLPTPSSASACAPAGGPQGGGAPGGGSPTARNSHGPTAGGYGPTLGYSLREGMGARRLAKFRSQAAVHILLVQACSEIYSRQHHLMPVPAVDQLLQTLQFMFSHASVTDMDVAVRKRLAMQQAEDRVPDDRLVCDPPLLAQVCICLGRGIGSWASGGQDIEGHQQ